MYFKKILTPSLMAYSYIIGDAGKAVVIDPRRDFGIYLEEAAKAGLQIIWALETHRHEDMISGAAGLAKACGGKAGYSRYEDLGQKFGTPIGNEDLIQLSETVVVRPLHTPGHTLGSLSYVVEIEGRPLYVATGDTLFFGGVGRTDFYGEANLHKMTSLLHESIYQKLAPLGDDVIVLPGHGAGSACGNDLAELEDSTIGRELAESKALSPDFDTFMALHGRMYYKNPAFSKMEWVNVAGSGDVAAPPLCICAGLPEDGVVVDIRDRFAYSGAHLQGAVLVPAALTANYVGWQVGVDEKICLCTDGLAREQIELAAATLYRTGFDNLLGCLPPNFLKGKAVAAAALEQIRLISAKDYLQLDFTDSMHTLDVRLPEEFAVGDLPLPNRIAIPLQELKTRLSELPEDGEFYVLCGSGERATVASGMLNRAKQLHVVAGGAMSLYNALAGQNA